MNNLFNFLTRIVLLLGLIFIFSSSVYAVTIHTSDFIAVGDRTNFNGFEGMPASFLDGPYTEDGIKVEQLNEDPLGISTFCVPCGQEGIRSWYPNAGDFGYTQITNGDGSDFESIGFLIGTGVVEGAERVLYELFDNGSSVLTGSFVPGFTTSNGIMDYLGFSDGGFDTIWLRDTTFLGSVSFGDANINALALDSIEMAGTAPISEPSTMMLLGSGLFGLGAFRRKWGIKE